MAPAHRVIADGIGLWRLADPPDKRKAPAPAPDDCDAPCCFVPLAIDYLIAPAPDDDGQRYCLDHAWLGRRKAKATRRQNTMVTVTAAKTAYDLAVDAMCAWRDDIMACGKAGTDDYEPYGKAFQAAEDALLAARDAGYDIALVMHDVPRLDATRMYVETIDEMPGWDLLTEGEARQAGLLGAQNTSDMLHRRQPGPHLSMAAHGILAAAHERIADRRRWTQGASARNGRGESIYIADGADANIGGAMCWCVSGAVQASGLARGDRDALGLAQDVLRWMALDEYGTTPVNVNDQQDADAGHKQVLELLAAAQGMLAPHLPV